MPSKRLWKWTVLSLEFPIPAFIGRKSKQNIPHSGLQFRKHPTLHSVGNGMGTIETSNMFLDIFEYEKQTSGNVD